MYGHQLKSHQYTIQNSLYSTLMWANLVQSLQKSYKNISLHQSNVFVSDFRPLYFWYHVGHLNHCLTSLEQNMHERKEWKSRKVLYLWSRETNFSWRTIGTLWREERFRESCVFTVSLQYISHVLRRWRRNAWGYTQLVLWMFLVLYINKKNSNKCE